MKIVKIVSVVDTREYEEQGDSFVPIPGSGNPNTCTRCGRVHEVHWNVLLEDGQEAVVGGSCAKAYSLDFKIVQGAERKASRMKRLTTELATYESRLSELERVIVEVGALKQPDFTIGEMTLKDGTKFPTISLADCGEVWCQFEGITHERKQLAFHGWVSKRISERTKVKETVYQLKSLIETTKKNLDMVREKLSNVVCA
jgi:uncharacterized protein (DUF342 family)